MKIILDIIALCMILLSGYFEIANRSVGKLPLSFLATRIVGSRFTNLLWYSCILFISMTSLGMYLIELSHSAVIFFMTIFGSIVLLFPIVAINRERFSESRRNPLDRIDIYLEAMEGMSPEEGIDYIIQYLQNPKWNAPKDEVAIFLSYMSKRDDAFGVIARERMKELGIEMME